ncbi:hypothetical protein SLS53_004191 [Cytospora paraplurivora]|uniref:Uncharacterized protein n=1 Tax=Cytospora paraplurivora TaxID=2898453 RepID=A0AAN9YGG4_9PEZI
MSSQKRKRSASVFSSGSRSSQGRHQHSHHLPSDSINPLSHSDGTIKQLRVAGLTEDDLLPSNYIPDFPHRPIPRPSHNNRDHPDDDDEGSDEGGRKDDDDDDDGEDAAGEEKAPRRDRDRAERRARRMRDAQDQHLGFLTGVILRALEEGDVPRARRAFGLLRRSEVAGKPVDLRRNGLWGLGAEILMRDGEVRSRSVVAVAVVPPEEVGEGGDGRAVAVEVGGDSSRRRRRRRWGSAGNITQLRTYLESLIRQYPYNRLHPNSISDLDFYPVLFSCEFYDTWVEHRLALERLAEESESWSDDDHIPDYGMDDDDDDDDDGAYHKQHDDLTGRERRLRQEKADLGLRALAAMRDVASRMDGLMENAPYSRSTELIRLRGMAALYIGDLSVPPSPRSGEEEEEEGNKVREQEQAKARALFTRMRQNGGQVDAYTSRWLGDKVAGQDDDYGEEDDDDGWGGLPVFSSIAVR